MSWCARTVECNHYQLHCERLPAGFPVMKGNVAFLMKDFVLLAASVYLLKQDVGRMVDSRDVGAAHAGDRRAVEAVP
jgi:uncharacterized membrane protein YkgB